MKNISKKTASLFFTLLATTLTQNSFAHQELLNASQTPSGIPARIGKFEFLKCEATTTEDGVTVSQWLTVSLITNSSLQPVSIEGSYSFYNQTEGMHASASLSGAIKGKYIEESSSYTSIVLLGGKLNINAEGDLQQEKLLSIGYNAAQTHAGFYATVAGSTGRARLTRLKGCQVKNLGLVSKIRSL